MSHASEMQDLVDRWQVSGLTQRAFANQEGMAYSRFQYWRRRVLEAERRKPAKRLAAPIQLDLVRVVPDAEPARSALPFELHTSSGLSLSVPVGFDELELHRLLDVLAAC